VGVFFWLIQQAFKLHNTMDHLKSNHLRSHPLYKEASFRRLKVYSYSNWNCVEETRPKVV